MKCSDCGPCGSENTAAADQEKKTQVTNFRSVATAVSSVTPACTLGLQSKLLLLYFNFPWVSVSFPHPECEEHGGYLSYQSSSNLQTDWLFGDWLKSHLEFTCIQFTCGSFLFNTAMLCSCCRSQQTFQSSVWPTAGLTPGLRSRLSDSVACILR